MSSSASEPQPLTPAAQPAAPAPAAPGPRRVEYYAESEFRGAKLLRTVHLGWGAVGGASLIFVCMVMSAVTQRRSWNVSFRWLQRRVGAQFGTLSYLVTSNLMYYHDGDRWVTRSWPEMMGRWAKKPKAGGPTFASGGA